MLEYVSEIIRWLVGFVLLGAAWGKLNSFTRFKQNLVDSFQFSETISQILAPFLILVECSLAIVILSNTTYSYLSMICALGVFIAFTTFLVYYWIKDARIKCGCFGEDDRPVSILDLLRNGLIILCLAIYLITSHSGQVQGLEVNVLLAGVALILSIVVMHFHDIFALLISPQGRR